MDTENNLRQINVAEAEGSVLQRSEGWKMLSRLGALIRAFSPGSLTDFTHEDWRRVEFGEKPVPCPHRDIITQYRGRI